jgi:hypothetical protein
MALYVGAIWDVCGAFGTLAVGSIAVHALAVTAARALFDTANATDRVVHRLPPGLTGRPVSITHVGTGRDLACTYRGDVSTAWTLGRGAATPPKNTTGDLYTMTCGDSTMTSVPLAALPESERVPRARQLWSFQDRGKDRFRIVAFRGEGAGQKVLAFAGDRLDLVGLDAAAGQLWSVTPTNETLTEDTTPKRCGESENAGTCPPPPRQQDARPWRKTTISSYDVMSYDNTEPGALNEWMVTRAFVDAVNVAAVHSEDWKAYKYSTVEIKFKGKTAEFQVWDYCADKDCDGCCSDNRGSNGFLLDLDSSAVRRIWGIEHAEEDLLEAASWRVVPRKTVTDPKAVAARYGGRPS